MKPKLELTWVGKNDHKRPEPRILRLVPELSKHAPAKVTESDIFNNILIQGDNLLALKALEQDYMGQVKCIFIDPPYNTGSAFEHYDDGLEHSLWLTMMRDRLELLHKLLAKDGSIWITVDDNESHYLKVMCDEIFGRNNFVRNIVWQKKYAASNDANGIPDSHDHILVYQKSDFSRRLLPRTDKQNDLYKYDDFDGKGLYRSDNLSVKTYSKSYDYPIKNPITGELFFPPKGRSWSTNPERMQTFIDENRVFFGKNGRGAPQLKRYLSEVQQGILATSWWTHEECGHNDESRKESKAIFGDEPFSTPKPERLLERILRIATNPSDLVLDSFAGSGTTGAVAHKMGRRWIMVELGEHAHTHIVPRLEKVVNGTDLGGISSAVGWKGGGGFRYYRLAPSLLQLDRFGQWIINKSYDAAMLSEAMCKLEGFKYSPSDGIYWMQGRSSETDFIYVTTQTLSAEQLWALSEDVGSGRSLLVCCCAFRAPNEDLSNLTVKKIPKAVLNSCTWGRDDYSLAVQALPAVPVAVPVSTDQSLFDLSQEQV